MKKIINYIIWFIVLFFCPQKLLAQKTEAPYILILGTAQDGGYPHIGCTKQCCEAAWKNASLKRNVVSLALVEPASKKWWLFEATPDIKEQLHLFGQLTKTQYKYLPDGIFITHAHIGHYTGLMELGKEAMNTKEVPVYVLPRMKKFLETNGPWSQLVKLQNIALHELKPDISLQLTGNIRVTAFLVPHRDEYSETAGFKIETSIKKYLFIPDINKWDKWDRNIITEVANNDIALLDGTFYDGTELPGLRMSEVPHPFVQETMALFSKTDRATKNKIYFIHLNHTNPLLWSREKQNYISQRGFQVAMQGCKL